MDPPMDTPPDGTRVIRAQRADVSVAIIDDEELQRRALRRLLQGKGFSVQDFESADAALRSGVLRSCELILLDVVLGRESGISVCRHLRKLKYAGGIVMISCLGHLDAKVEALDAGADDYVTKPAEGEELRARLRSVLRRVRAARASHAGAHLRLKTVLEALKPGADRRILRQLVAAKGEPVERDALKAFGLENPRATDKALEKHIERMRDVLEPLGVRVETVVGTGYSCSTQFD